MLIFALGYKSVRHDFVSTSNVVKTQVDVWGFDDEVLSCNHLS